MEDLYFWTTAYFRTKLIHGVGNGTEKYRGSWYITISNSQFVHWKITVFDLYVFCVFVCFCHSYSSSDAAAKPLNSRVIREERIGKNVEGCGRGPGFGNISLFGWKDWGKLQQISTSSHDMQLINRYLKRKPLERGRELYSFSQIFRLCFWSKIVVN